MVSLRRSRTGRADLLAAANAAGVPLFDPEAVPVTDAHGRRHLRPDCWWAAPGDGGRPSRSVRRRGTRRAADGLDGWCQHCVRCQLLPWGALVSWSLGVAQRERWSYDGLLAVAGAEFRLGLLCDRSSRHLWAAPFCGVDRLSAWQDAALDKLAAIGREVRLSVGEVTAAVAARLDVCEVAVADARLLPAERDAVRDWLRAVVETGSVDAADERIAGSRLAVDMAQRVSGEFRAQMASWELLGCEVVVVELPEFTCGDSHASLAWRSLDAAGGPPAPPPARLSAAHAILSVVPHASHGRTFAAAVPAVVAAALEPDPRVLSCGPAPQSLSDVELVELCGVVASTASSGSFAQRSQLLDVLADIVGASTSRPAVS